MENLLEENKKLRKEIQELKNQIEEIEENERRSRKSKIWLSKKAAGIFLGWRLKRSMRKLFKEVSEKNVQNETIADVSTHLLWRFTRIGIFAILPTFLLIIQAFFTIQISLASNQLTKNANQLAASQNAKSDMENALSTHQNELIDRQIEVEHYKRKVNFMNDLNNLIENLNNNPSLGVVNQIAYYSKNWSTEDTIEISNEKSILLTEISTKDIKEDKLELIFKQSDFSNSMVEINDVNKDFIKILKTQYNFSESESDSIHYIIFKDKK